MPGALSHLTVAELCDEIPGAACGRQFASWGADVTVIERSSGSALRRAGPVVDTGELAATCSTRNLVAEFGDSQV